MRDYFHFMQHILLLLMISDLLLFGMFYQQDPDSSLIDMPLASVSTSGGEGKFANLSIANSEQLSLPKAYVLVNGKRSGDFSAGQCTLRVYDGDIIDIDCTAYGRQLNFTLQPISSSLVTSYLEQTVSCRQNCVSAGVIVIL